MQTNQIRLGLFFCAFISLMLINPSILMAKSITLKVSHQFSAGDVRDQMARVFGDMVTEKTNGEVKFRYYPAKSLYKPKEQWDALRRGGLDMAVFPLDYASGKNMLMQWKVGKNILIWRWMP